MKNFASLAVIALVALFIVSPVQAETAEQSQEQELKTSVVCETGAYGQTSKCEATAEGKQSQRQKITVLGASTDKKHVMADTSLDMVSMIAAAGIITTGAGVAVKKFVLK